MLRCASIVLRYGGARPRCRRTVTSLLLFCRHKPNGRDGARKQRFGLAGRAGGGPVSAPALTDAPKFNSTRHGSAPYVVVHF